MEEIMNVGTEEVIEVVEVAESKPGKGFVIAAVVGGTALVGTFIYKKVIKPIVAKCKAKKAAKAPVCEDVGVKKPYDYEAEEE